MASLLWGARATSTAWTAWTALRSLGLISNEDADELQELLKSNSSFAVKRLKSMLKLAPLYRPIEPYSKGHLDVGDGHQIYYEQCGNSAGKPVVVLHGGPGSGCGPKMRQFFDPQAYRIVLFDQRGCGRSTPLGSLKDNSTFNLVGDIEKLRKHLRVDRWQVFGGSWGSTLALAYAVTHPERVTELVLRGIFMGTQKETDWIFEDGGANEFYAENWKKYRDHIPAGERSNLLHAYHRRLTSKDKKVQLAAAKHWNALEGGMTVLRPDLKQTAELSPDVDIARARIENFYFVKKCFFPRDGWLFEAAQLEKIQDIPTVIAQGRYDMICPPRVALQLHRALPKSEMYMVPDAGHSALEPGMIDQLVRATKRFAKVANHRSKL